MMEQKRFCECGCGTKIEILPSGWQARFVKGHHLKGKKIDLESRIKRIRARHGSATLSPFLPSTFVHFNKKAERWYACVSQDGTKRQLTHAKAVYERNFGQVPGGHHVHHKDGNHSTLHDDRPENLMLLPDEWNLRFFPVLSKGYGVPESVVTDLYVKVFDKSLSKEELFSRLNEELIENLRKR